MRPPTDQQREYLLADLRWRLKEAERFKIYNIEQIVAPVLEKAFSCGYESAQIDSLSLPYEHTVIFMEGHDHGYCDLYGETFNKLNKNGWDYLFTCGNYSVWHRRRQSQSASEKLEELFIENEHLRRLRKEFKNDS